MRFDSSFDVDEVALVESTLTPTGARYETVATWPTASRLGSDPTRDA
jgi:2'-5' RNA ligase